MSTMLFMQTVASPDRSLVDANVNIHARLYRACVRLHVCIVITRRLDTVAVKKTLYVCMYMCIYAIDLYCMYACIFLC